MSAPDLLEGLLADLGAESDALRAVVADLGPEGWGLETPAQGWTVAHQVAHLAWTDECATLAARSLRPEGEQAWQAVVAQAVQDPTGFVDSGAHEGARLAPAELLARWDVARDRLGAALREVPAGSRMPWFGPPMSALSMATARFMETWAHSLDVYDALPDVTRPEPTDRIRHVAHIGVRTRDFAYSVHGQTPPTEEFRIELVAPSGELWAWGPQAAAQRITGSAYEFCELVTQRVHRDDTSLAATGPDAEHWLGIAQAFAGPAGGGREQR